MRGSVKRAFVCLVFLAIGYALGFYDGAPPYGQIPLGPLLLLLFLTPIFLAKLAALLFSLIKQGWSSPGSGDAPSPRVPRPPTGKPPALTASQALH
jgi:hypothetical protein